LCIQIRNAAITGMKKGQNSIYVSKIKIQLHMIHDYLKLDTG
jgi:hypothetical protein